MQLTKHTDYAFRILMYLAAMQEERTTIQQMAESLDISKNHTMKIVNKLAHTGWLSASRGKNGGICLGVEPKRISARSVVELMEQTLVPVNCESPPCVLNQRCELKKILWDAQQQYLKHLAKFTLADLLNKATRDIITLIE